MPDQKSKPRKRVVVEEVSTLDTEDLKSNVDNLDAALDESSERLDAVKEKVEELQDLTEEIGESAEKSAEIEEEIVEVAEKAQTVEKPVDQKPPLADFAPPYPKKNSINPLTILIPGVLLLGALLGGIYFYQKGVKITDQTMTPTPSGTEISPVPSASPEATVDLTKYTVNILNGSGISGEAGKVKTLLEDAGFNVGNTGNASTYDFKETIVKAKKDVDQAYLVKLVETLSKNYKVATTEELPDSSKDEVQITVGSSKSE